MIDFSQFNSIELSVGSLVQMAFYLVLGIYAIFSIIFYYHWNSYGTDIKVTALTLILYFATTIPLLIVMAVLAFIV